LSGGFLPSGFLLGAATSGHQIEGGNDQSDWWKWESEGRCEGGARSGRATDHWNRFHEDLKLAAELGLNSYRFSIEWSRIEPEEGRWDPAAIERYREIIGECERLGLLPMVTLHHFTSPRWFADKGGFVAPESVKYFTRFAAKIAVELGARVPLWCTFNEPMVLAVGTYLGKFMPPAEYSPRNASLACRHLLLSHVRAYDLLHSMIQKREGPWKDRPLRVGIAHNMLDFKPDRKWHPIERILARIFRRFYNRSWLDAITGRKQHFGILGLVPYPRQVGEALGRKTCDYIGVNYYTKAYVRWRPHAPAPEVPQAVPIGIEFARRSDVVSDVGWAIYPKGFARILRFAGRYDLPVYVTENGIADREDQHRGAYIEQHLEVVESAIRAGLPVEGYYYWSLLDNFEWIKGFGPRFGLFHVDYESFERTARPSAQVLRKWSKS
jgi:beta-glucosidase